MDYEEIIAACQRGQAIESWIESIENGEDQGGLMCQFIDRMIYFDNEDAENVFLKALRMELETIHAYIARLSQ